MSVCPVCKNNHQQEVSKCQRCGWSMKNDLGIDSDHEILTTCIPTILSFSESQAAENKQLQSMIQKIELQEADSRKLDEILDELETDRKQTHKNFEKLSEIITELKTSLLEARNGSSNIPTKAQEKILAIQNISASTESSPESNQTSKENIAIKDSNSELLGQTDYHQNNPVSLPGFLIDSKHHNGFGNQDDLNLNNNSNSGSNPEEGNFYSSTSDRNPYQNFESTNELQLGSLYDNQSDRQIIETVTPQEDNSKKTANSNNSYQSFYRLIKRRELEFTVVTIPQEIIEKARSGTQSELNFEEDKKGNYWIVHWHDVYCLIPKEKNIINQYQYANFQRAFNCEGYYEEYSDLEVIEPAIATNYDSKNWRLERKGKIKFV